MSADVSTSEEGGVDFESALVTAILDSKDIRTVIKHKVNSDFLFSPTGKAAFQFLMNWYKNPHYGDVPSWERFSADFASFNVTRLDDSLIAIIDKVREQKLYHDVASVIQEVAEEASVDVAAGFALMKQKVAALTSAHTIDNASDIRNRVEELKAEYFEMRDGETGLKGKPYPWDALNQATLGLQSQQLIFLYGRPKSGKTWLALEIARCLHANGSRPIIFSQELSDIEICRRYVALATNVDYDLYLRGALPEEAEAAFLENLDMFVESQPIIVDFLSTHGEEVLIELKAKVDEYDANVVIIDGVHTLGDDWKELKAICHGLKRYCKGNNVPVLGVTHANRSRGKKGEDTDQADDMAHSDAFFQTGDLCLRVTAEIEDRKARQCKLFTAAIREGKSTLFTVNMQLAEDLTQKSMQFLGEPTEDIEAAIDESQLDQEGDARAE